MEKYVTKNKNTNKIQDSIEFEQVIERGCGLDVHRDTVVATIQGKGIQSVTKTYSTFTVDLKALKTWLKENNITHVAMESTGVYWKPVINILGEDFTILLVNARHIKNVPGHKTDKKDSKWIAKLLLSGLLKGSFIPNKTIGALRELTRYRTRLNGMLASEKNRFLKIIESTNIKLSRVLTDVFCHTGRKIIKHILEKESYQPSELLVLIHGRVKASQEDLQKALEGKIELSQGYLLKAIMDHIEDLEARIEEHTKEIEKMSGP
jgi:transposase